MRRDEITEDVGVDRKRRGPGLRSLHSEVEEDPAENMRWNGEGGDGETEPL